MPLLIRRREIVCACVLALNLCRLGIVNAGLPRVAVIGDEGTATAADLAFDALSKSDRWELVERQRLDAVLKEQKLAASGWTAADALKLGQLVKADGVLLLVGRAAKDKQTMAVRLVAVNPGVILWSLHQPLPLENVADWQTTIGSRVDAALPKLSVLAEDAVPLSVVSVTSGVKRRDFLRIEGELRQLLIHRLTHEPSLFVLERQQLELLDREKSQPGPTNPLAEQPFWTGRHLIEAELNQDLNDGTKLDVTVTLARPGGLEPKRLTATGRSDQLPALAEDLVKQIVRTLDREPTGAAWPAKAEAERFFQTARWLRNNSDWNSEAGWEAVEAAWSLGLRTDDVYSWRVQGLLRKGTGLANRDTGHFVVTHNKDGTVQRRWERKKRDLAPIIEVLEEAARFALERPLAKDAFYRFTEQDTAGMHAANSLAGSINSLTRTDNPSGSDLAELRRLTRKLFEEVEDAPAWKLELDGEQRLENVWTWTERPADTVAVYRRLLAPEAQPSKQILRFRWRERFNCRLANWHGASPEEMNRVQQEFLKELKQSTDPENKLTGYREAMTLAAKGEAQAKAQAEFEDAIWSLRDELASGRLSCDYLSWCRVTPARESIDFFLKLFVEFSGRRDCDTEALYRAFLAVDHNREKLSPEPSRTFHAALRRAVARNVGSYQGTMFRRTLRDLEEKHPELATPDEAKPSSGGMVIRRLGWPKLSNAAADAPKGTLEGEYTTATWHGDRLWIIATIDGKIGVLVVNVATNASEFLPLPRPNRDQQSHLLQLFVADDALFVGLDHRDAPRKDGLFRYDRSARRWNIVENAYGLDSGFAYRSLTCVGRRVYSLFVDSPFDNQAGTKPLSPNAGVMEIDLQSEQVKLVVSQHRRQGGSPLDDAAIRVFALRAGPNDALYVLGGVPVPSAPPRSLVGYAYSPKDETWREIKPSEWQDAERQAPQRRVLSAFGGVVHNWPGTKTGPQYWADDRDSWYGQPTRAILYGDETTGGIVSIPVSLTLDGDFGRRHLPEAAKLTDAAIARRVGDTTSAWLLTPGGVLFSGPKQPFWWFVEADEIRRAAHAQARAAAISSVAFQQPLVLSEHKPGRKKQLQAATADGKTAPWLRSIWNDRQPTVSPDGKRVAFVSDRLDNDDIFLINADGSGLQNLTDSWADDSEPKFSADGKRLSFRSTHRGNTETRTIDLP